MAGNEEWDGFASTGKVMDYLQYRGCIDRMTNLSDVTSGLVTAGNIPFAVEENRRSHEGFNQTYRDGDSVSSDERV